MGLVMFVARDPNGCATQAELSSSVYLLASKDEVTKESEPSKTNSPRPAAKQTGGKANMNEWTFYDGDVNEYYNELEKDIKRDAKNLEKYAVHRWMGTDHSTKHHYELMLESILKYTGLTRPSQAQGLQVLDAGCGLGAGMMWFETKQPSWKITGRTLSVEQSNFIQEKLQYNTRNFKVELRSYDDLDEGSTYDAIYSIEAMIHSPDIHKTISAWAKHLDPHHGSLVIVDDFLMPGADKSSEEMQGFMKGWMAQSFYSVNQLNNIGRKYGIELVESRDLLAEYRIVELNYRNTVPNLAPDGKKTHQGWIGAKLRHKLTVEGQIGYFMLTFRKIGAKKPQLESWIAAKPTVERRTNIKLPHVPALRASTVADDSLSECGSVPVVGGGESAYFQEIVTKKECLSSWYCCDQHTNYLNKLRLHRTNTHGFLKMSPSLFGNYMEAFAKHLNKFYKTIPSGYKSGRFLDIGATGSTASGMTQVTTKFQHFAGPLEYWMLDSDQGAQTLNRTVYCDICDCPQADTCGFDVTFSHTVLEHAARPEQAFDTVARLTKKGGLTMHLVPWSYQYHATPDDYYRFSHSALKVLMEDRGFEPLEIGYDLCSKPEHVMKRVDEHYDFIWLTYVIAKKK